MANKLQIPEDNGQEVTPDMPVAKETADWLVDRIIRRLLMSSNEAVVNLIFALARVCFDLCLAGTCTTVWYTGGLHSRQNSCCV